MPNIENENKNLQIKKQEKKIKFRKILKFTLIIIFTCLVGVTIFAYSLFNDNRDTTVDKNIDSNLKKPNIITSFFTPVEKRMNFLIMGVDKEDTRTDFMMVGCFNTVTKKIDLISIPRDTYVVIPDDRIQLIKDAGRLYPKKGYCKLTEVHSYAGEKYGVSFTVKQIEELLGIELEYYIRIDLDAFKYLVNEIGGVDFYVPQRMLYSDPLQDLEIDLMPGQQKLDGDASEGLIRYRHPNEGNEKISPGYALGDLHRLDIQQDFMKALISQVLSKDNIIKNAEAVVNTSYKYVTTNFTASEIPKYLKYAKGLSISSISTHTMPWYIKEVPGSTLSFVGIDKNMTKELVDSIFYDEEDKFTSSKLMNIQILNGGYTKGLATNKKEILEEAGFRVNQIGDYSDEKKSETRILVKENGMGKDLIAFFEDASITVDSSLETDEIVVILGINQK